MTQPITIFISCADEDKGFLEELLRQLSGLIREGRIEYRHRYQINAGNEWREQVKKDLEKADIILLLVSSFFISSDYYYGEEAVLAMGRYRAGKACVIPVIVRSVEWKHLIFGGLKSLPGEKAVSMWSNREKAFLHIVRGIKATIDELQSKARYIIQTADKPLLLWNVPYWRNPFFTSREEVVLNLRETFDSLHLPLRVQALSGLGGIGKTQVAVEYAYRFAQNYQAVLWIHADSPDTIGASFVNLAELLELPERNETNQPAIVKAVKQWLQQNTRWLLIVDNLENLDLLQDTVPAPHSGHILVTTRSRRTGHNARRLNLSPMNLDDGALFLLRRANILPPDTTLHQVSATEEALAKRIVQELAGLPLALDQAGAYLEETGRGLSDYVDLYQKHISALLKRRGTSSRDHPASVTTTFSLSFEKLRGLNAAAAELLTFCAFLQPDDIPEAMLIGGASVLYPLLRETMTDPLEFDQAIGDLLTFSLIQRDPERQALAMHRLVQEVTKGSLSEEERTEHARQVVCVLNASFPQVSFSTWPLCQRYLPQALACARLIQQRHISLPEATQLLYRTGVYLSERGLYDEAESLLLQASTVESDPPGTDHSGIIPLLNALANVYYKKGQYDQVEPIMLRSLALSEKTIEKDATTIAEGLNTLARAYHKQGRFVEEEPLLQRALALRQQTLGAHHSEVAASLNSLANLYNGQEKYMQAEDLYRQALTIWQQILGPQHPKVALSLNNLAVLSSRQGKYVQAEPLAIQALEIYEAALGQEHPDITIALDTLTVIYQEQKQFSKADVLYQRIFALYERHLGSQHPQLVVCYNNMARFHLLQHQYAEAEAAITQALAIGEKVLGMQHHRIGTSFNTLADIYQAQQRYAEAVEYYQHALAIREKALGPDNTNTIRTRESYAALLQKMGQEDETK